MVQPIMKDMIFLAQRSEPATPADAQVGQDLLDTLAAHREGCVGMAANMIGVRKRVIVFDDEGALVLMYNPEIVEKSGEYEAEEGCLSLTGTRPAKRFERIRVTYQNAKFEQKRRTFRGFTAQIIQHEIDHCDGILI